VTNHALAGIEEIAGHYGHNRLKVSHFFSVHTLEHVTSCFGRWCLLKAHWLHWGCGTFLWFFMCLL